MNTHQKIVKAALYRASHRGSKEADAIIGGFVKIWIERLNDDELISLNLLLLEDDSDILELVEFYQSTTHQYCMSLLQKMHDYAYHYVKSL